MLFGGNKLHLNFPVNLKKKIALWAIFILVNCYLLSGFEFLADPTLVIVLMLVI